MIKKTVRGNDSPAAHANEIVEEGRLKGSHDFLEIVRRVSLARHITPVKFGKSSGAKTIKKDYWRR